MNEKIRVVGVVGFRGVTLCVTDGGSKISGKMRASFIDGPLAPQFGSFLNIYQIFYSFHAAPWV
jgi:hypothetical protein